MPRKKKAPHLVKTPCSVGLPPWMWGWLDKQEISRSSYIERLIIKAGAKPPKK